MKRYDDCCNFLSIMFDFTSNLNKLFASRHFFAIKNGQLLYVVGTPIGLPHIPDPTQADIDKWHDVYCNEVRKIFETYKEKAPMYKHKKLFID